LTIRRNIVVPTVFLAAIAMEASLAAQNPAAGRGPAVAPRPSAYPIRPPADPAVLERGRATYGVNCNFCHGSDARGGEGGPSLLRSELVLDDQNGELIAPVVQNGRPDQGMPKFNLTNAQVAEVAAYIHNFKVSGNEGSRMVPPSVLVGDAKAGEAYFKSKCGACHSPTGDLKGIGSRIPDAKLLQNTFMMPGGGGRGPAAPVKVPPTTVSVTAAGKKVEGTLVRIDDFLVTLTEADGTLRSFRRDGDNPKVEIHDPLLPHKNLLPVYADKDIHNLTAYLVTLK
jgi:cytochrome c oxidase cbb3-type subunit 3